MSEVRNPFAIKDGVIILINDLSANQRGLKCNCRCPACDGEFIARMGMIKIHHFAHSKDPCDETIAYTTGLYKLIQQVLLEGKPFYLPALEIMYNFPFNDVLNEHNFESYVSIVGKYRKDKEYMLISDGKNVIADNIELSYDNKNYVQALELRINGKKMAIKVMPPDTICKIASVKPHQDMATLVLDFTNEIEIIQNVNSKNFQKFLLSEELQKYWISNPKIKDVFHKLVELSKEHYERRQRYLAEQKLEEEKQREALEKQRAIELAEKLKREEEFRLSLKERFTQQKEPIYDDNRNRLIQCKICNEIKPAVQIHRLGGYGELNLGECKACVFSQISKNQNRR